MSERSSPENRKSKRQKTSEDVLVEEKKSSPLNSEIQNLQKVHSEFEQFLDVVSDDLKEKVEKQKIMKETDKNYYTGVQVFMLTKYKNRIERLMRSTMGRWVTSGQQFEFGIQCSDPPPEKHQSNK